MGGSLSAAHLEWGQAAAERRPLLELAKLDMLQRVNCMQHWWCRQMSQMRKSLHAQNAECVGFHRINLTKVCHRTSNMLGPSHLNDRSGLLPKSFRFIIGSEIVQLPEHPTFKRTHQNSTSSTNLS